MTCYANKICLFKLSDKETQENVRREEDHVLPQAPSLAAHSQAQKNGAVDLGWAHAHTLVAAAGPSWPGT